MEPLWETLLSLAGLLFIVIKAASPIITTTITERAKTERLRMGLGSSESNDMSANSQTTTRSLNRLDANLGLLAVLLASVQFAWMQFGPDRSALLSLGSAAAIAQSLSLLGLGGWLLTRGRR